MIRHHHISERACGRRASHGERFIRCHAKFIPPLLILARRYSWDSRHGPVKRRTCRFSGPRNKLGAVWGPRDYSPQPNRDLMLTNRETHTRPHQHFILVDWVRGFAVVFIHAKTCKLFTYSLSNTVFVLLSSYWWLIILKPLLLLNS